MTTTALKLFALVLMFIDHLAEFVPGIPPYFHWIGRISAPIFVFCTVWGFHYTHDRKKYLTRMYVFGAFMGLMDTALNTFVENPYALCTNNIFVTLLLSCLIVAIWDIRKQDKKRGNRLVLRFIAFQIATLVLTVGASYIFTNKNMYMFVAGILPNLLSCEGGPIFVLLGVLLYYNKETKVKVAISYTIFCVAFFFMSLSSGQAFCAQQGITLWDFMINYNYQWMQIAALPFLLMYNGQKGKGFKYLFYIFYPAHILILFLIGNFMIGAI